MTVKGWPPSAACRGSVVCRTGHLRVPGVWARRNSRKTSGQHTAAAVIGAGSLIFARMRSSPRLRHSAFRSIAKNACRTDAAISCAEHVTRTRRYTMTRGDKALILIALGRITHGGGQLGKLTRARKSPLTHWRCGLLYWLRGLTTTFTEHEPSGGVVRLSRYLKRRFCVGGNTGVTATGWLPAGRLAICAPGVAISPTTVSS